MPTLIKNKKAGVVGLPAGVKEAGRRVDFRVDDFTLMVETKGYRLAWTRTALCPCAPVNDQTKQADPNCPICEGAGWIFFRPEEGTINEKTVGKLTDLQKKILGTDATVIRGIMTGITGEKQPWDPVGPRLEGMASCTVRAENKLGYYDRLTNLDAVVTYAQLIEAASPLVLRYPAAAMNLLRSTDTTYVAGTHFNLVEGDVVWETGMAPATGTLLSAHYLCHPTWRVINHPHMLRVTPVKKKQAKPLTPQGEPVDMPINAVVKYEWLL